jgi:hypothetical protein
LHGNRESRQESATAGEQPMVWEAEVHPGEATTGEWGLIYPEATKTDN